MVQVEDCLLELVDTGVLLHLVLAEAEESRLFLSFRKGGLHLLLSSSLTSKFGQPGLHELAEEQERVVVSGASYYSKSEYRLQGDKWKERFWGLNIYLQLLEVKTIWDPTRVFSCRHSVGDGELRGEVGPRTQPF